MFLDPKKYNPGVNFDLLSKIFKEELLSIPVNNYKELIEWYMNLRRRYNVNDESTIELYDIEICPDDGTDWFCAKIWDINEKRVDPTSKTIFSKTTEIAKNLPGLVRMHINIVGPNSVVPDHVDTEMNLDSEQHSDTPVYHLLLNVEVGQDGDVFIINENERVDINEGDVTFMPVDVIHSGVNSSTSYWIILAIVLAKSEVERFYE
jgi:hypothetical protein